MEESETASISPRAEEAAVSQLLDGSLNIADRWWALFSVRNMKGSVGREALISAMRDPSTLLAHEAAFALGQMQDPEAIPALREVLEDVASVSSIVRHEAAEALGAIGAPVVIAVLKESLVSDPAPEVRETCELALRRIELQSVAASTGDCEDTLDSPFFSVDPAGPACRNSSTSDLRCLASLWLGSPFAILADPQFLDLTNISETRRIIGALERKILLDEDVRMYERYAALFALRNRGGSESVDAVIAALGAKSALLRHEVAYVLGQLQDKSSTDALVRTLMDSSEHPMVRHEAAEALGPIADTQSVALIRKFLSDPELLVAQSCEVALSLLDQELHGKSLENLHIQTPVA